MTNYLKRNPYLCIQDILGQMHPLKFKLVDKVLSYLVTISDLILLQLSELTLSEISKSVELFQNIVAMH